MTYSNTATSCLGQDSTTNSMPFTFRLGMPHLGPAGLSIPWALKQACHGHWWQLADRFDISPSGMRNRDGKRAFASVVACTMNGQYEGFHEDALCRVEIVESPRPENGWLSQTDFEADNGARFRVELVTAFAFRDGLTNRNLLPAEIDGIPAAARGTDDARRADVIRRLGCSDRAGARQNAPDPTLQIGISRTSHFNGVGLVYFAWFPNFFMEAETRLLPQLDLAFELTNRRVHYFGNIDAGDCLEISVNKSVHSLSSSARLVIRSSARRRSDGEVIAVSESIYRW